jgi:hypothetical protein
MCSGDVADICCASRRRCERRRRARECKRLSSLLLQFRVRLMEACVHERHPRSAVELERAPSSAARGSEGRPIAIVDKARRVSLLGARSKPRVVGAGTAASDTATVSPPASAHGTDSRAGTTVISFSIFDDTWRELVHCGDVAHRRSLFTAVEVQHAHSDNPNAVSRCGATTLPGHPPLEMRSQYLYCC